VQDITKSYRGKDNQGEWIYGSCALDDDGQAYIIVHQGATVKTKFNCWRHILADNVCKLTPYSDDFKKPLYENDIVRISSDRKILLGKITMRGYEWGVLLLESENFIPLRDIRKEFLGVLFLEVTGNIYDNQAMIRNYKGGM